MQIIDRFVCLCPHMHFPIHLYCELVHPRACVCNFAKKQTMLKKSQRSNNEVTPLVDSILESILAAQTPSWSAAARMRTSAGPRNVNKKQEPRPKGDPYPMFHPFSSVSLKIPGRLKVTGCGGTRTNKTNKSHRRWLLLLGRHKESTPTNADEFNDPHSSPCPNVLSTLRWGKGGTQTANFGKTLDTRIHVILWYRIAFCSW